MNIKDSNIIKEELHKHIIGALDLMNEAPEDDFGGDDMGGDDPFASDDMGGDDSSDGGDSADDSENADEEEEKKDDGNPDFSDREPDADFNIGEEPDDSVVLNGVPGAIRFDIKKVEDILELTKTTVNNEEAPVYDGVANMYRVIFNGFKLTDEDFDFEDYAPVIKLVNEINSKLDKEYANYASLKIKSKLIELRNNIKLDKNKKDNELDALRNSISKIS